MKKYFRISFELENTLWQTIVGLVLAFGVMIYINGFIGGMGGVPAFVGFFASYYLLRAIVISGKRIGHFVSIDSKTEVLYLFRNYFFWYLLIWGIMKMIMLFSKITGWGSVDGMTAGEYFGQIYGQTMLERWAYFFVCILMFAFVMSLFPLAVIRIKRYWLVYLLADISIFAVICLAIDAICRPFIENVLEERANCVLDNLLLTVIPEKWEAVLYIVGVFILCIFASFIACRIAIHAYGPKQGKVFVPKDLPKLVSKEEKAAEYLRRKKQIRFRAGVCGIILLASTAILIYVFFGQNTSTTNYHKVAEYLTDDEYGPIYYGGAVYVPVTERLSLYEDGIAIGYLADKKTNCETRFFALTEGNLLYKDKNYDDAYLQLYGTDDIAYRRAIRVEEDKEYTKDSVFLLWDEDWASESLHSNDITGYSTCDADFVKELEDEFGIISYKAVDFEGYDAYFSITGFEDLKDAFVKEVPIGDWVGCILVKDNEFYYGGYDNKITGDSKEKLLSILGGYEN